ncbi:hypothetical protein ULMS_26600 [Patiriisocius marinistellae]|uniref:Uncharacterized protein n=1 Tax=Patiriisocius marinistellae TaxID=2494560 RepID=A0A5J4G0N5_9FLAO|nr:DUF6588 family protein [Patiriisocius marinistellae]GEQ87152.1 hypothetical protein ULMS_26600 [Patiriisocius marinistellae]
MKRLFIVPLLFAVATINAQQNIEDLLAAGVEDAQRYTSNYIAPAAEAMMYSTSNGWIQTAESKKPLKFEISFVANATFSNDENREFLLNTNEYNNLQFRDGSTSKMVATALGENDPDIIVFAEVSNIVPGLPNEEVEFELPQGLASADVNIVPSAFLQARLGLFSGAEIKARYFPKVEQEDVKLGLYGVGLQYEFTKLLPADKIFPIAIAGVVGYTHLDANYDFTDTDIIDGENQQFDVQQDSYVFQLQASTKLPIFNVYGGVGYLTGTSDFGVLGTYRVRAGIPLFESTSTFTNPFSISQKISGVRANVGAHLKLGFFKFNVDYTLSEFNSLSAGLNFGI